MRLNDNLVLDCILIYFYFYNYLMIELILD